MENSSSLVDEMLSHLKCEDVPDYEADSQIASCYANRSVFITGATGFLGKCLIEKLVRSCRDIKRIYVLIREKQGQEVEERLLNLLQSQVFDRIKSQPSGLELLKGKLRAVKGDITLPKFGISSQDMDELAKEVNIVFNSAATIRFTEPIEVAVKNNIYSLGQLVEFCNGLENLEALIHLSTAYSNCHKRDTIYEIFYEPPMLGDQIIEVVKTLENIQNSIHTYPNLDGRQSKNGLTNGPDEKHEPPSDHVRDACELQKFYKRNSDGSKQNITADLLDQFTQIAMRRGNRPNTYTYTKAIAENYLLELVKRKPERYLNGKIPVAIVRPSIVCGSLREPDVGFIDNYNGGTGPILSLYTGTLQAMIGRADRVADIVPIDMVCNMIISAGWYLVQADPEADSHGGSADLRPVKRDHGVYIFNFVSGYRNPIRWGLITDLIAEVSYRYPSKMLYRLPSSYFIVAGPLYDLYDFINHGMVAQVLDFMRASIFRQKLTRKTSAVAGYRRVCKMTGTLAQFTSNQWRLCDSNVAALYQRLSPRDKQLFQFDVAQIEWPKYMRNYIIGSRIHLMKDEAGSLPVAMRILKKKQMINRVSMAILVILFYYFFCHQSRLESALLSYLGQFL